MTPPDEAASAFTYAWWLTGDDTAAERAVLAAVRNIPPDGTRPDLVTLLRAVRSHATTGRTMCPASELALLHDGQSVALDLAADLAAVPADEARTELAHGRLEALLETVREPFAHPERLGGLAVGNPPDVAHARTCASCERAQDLLRRGRQEVLAMAAVPTPEAVRSGFPRPAPSPDVPATAPPAVPPGSAGGHPRSDGPPATSRPPLQATPGQRRGTLLLAFAVTTAVLLLLLAALTGGEPGAGAAATALAVGPHAAHLQEASL